MLYSEKVKGFTAAHPCEELTAGGARYTLYSGRKSGRLYPHHPQLPERGGRTPVIKDRPHAGRGHPEPPFYKKCEILTTPAIEILQKM